MAEPVDWRVEATPPKGFEYGPEIQCADPVDGMARLSDEAQARGLVIDMPGTWQGTHWEGIGGHVVAQDMDGDDDIDILFGQEGGLPALFVNDGAGHFQQAPPPPLPPPPTVFSGVGVLGAVDLTGDGLPEIVAVDFDVIVWPNEGGTFGTPTMTVPTDGRSHIALTLGDADADGDLDLLLSTSVDDSHEQTTPPDLLLLWERGANHEGRFVVHGPLYASAKLGVSSQVALFTDRDGDGDQDLLVPNNNYNATDQQTAFFRNESSAGALSLVDDAPQVGADLPIAGMGVDSQDLNGDGFLDYCITDVGPTACILSRADPDLRYVNETFEIGLTPDDWPYEGWAVGSIGWSFDFADLDNDGYPEAVQTGAPDHGSQATRQGLTDWPDLIFRGGPGATFTDVTAEAGFGDPHPHYGLATADFNADGYLDIVVAGPGVNPRLYMNSCGANAWLELELVGPPENAEGIGARVVVEDSRGAQLRELYTVRATGQTPSRFHFGLGGDGAARRVTVTWPDGRVASAEHVPVRRLITVRHPSAE